MALNVKLIIYYIPRSSCLSLANNDFLPNSIDSLAMSLFILISDIFPDLRPCESHKTIIARAQSPSLEAH